MLRVRSSEMLLHVDKKQIFHTIYNRPSPHFLIAWRNANGFGSNFNCCHEGQIVMLKKYFGNIGAETFDSFCRKYFTHLTITWECFLENWRSNKNLKLNLQTLRNLWQHTHYAHLQTCVPVIHLPICICVHTSTPGAMRRMIMIMVTPPTSTWCWNHAHC